MIESVLSLIMGGIIAGLLVWGFMDARERAATKERRYTEAWKRYAYQLREDLIATGKTPGPIPSKVTALPPEVPPIFGAQQEQELKQFGRTAVKRTGRKAP